MILPLRFSVESGSFCVEFEELSICETDFGDLIDLGVTGEDLGEFEVLWENNNWTSFKCFVEFWCVV